MSNPEKLRQWGRESYYRCKAANPKQFSQKRIFRERRRTSNRDGVTFNVTLEYVLSLPSSNCPILHVPLEWGTGSETTGSLDRIIPSLGYIEGNIQWVSWRANTLKNSASFSEIKQLYEWMKNVETS